MQADVVQLKKLTNMLRLTAQRGRRNRVTCLPLMPTTVDTTTTMKYQKKFVKEHFPRPIEQFEATHMHLSGFDLRIIRIKNLSCLDLSNNAIQSLPKEMMTMKLLELNLAGNAISEFPQVLCSGNLVGLRILDMSRNGIVHVPDMICQLKNLVSLNLANNNLQYLPDTLCEMPALKYFCVKHNQLTVLPHTFSRLSLWTCNLFANPFATLGQAKKYSLKPPTLQELSARAIKGKE